MKNDITIGINAVSCKDCEKLNKGTEIYKQLCWHNDGDKSMLLSYDKSTETILVNEDMLMHLIQLANPIEKKRNIKLVCQDYFFNRKCNG